MLLNYYITNNYIFIYISLSNDKPFFSFLPSFFVSLKCQLSSDYNLLVGFFLVLLLIAALESCVCLSHSLPLLTHKYLIRSQLLKRRKNMTARVLIGARGGFVGAAESRLHLMHVSLRVQRRSRPSKHPPARLTAQSASFPQPQPWKQGSRFSAVGLYCYSRPVKKSTQRRIDTVLK